MLDKFSTCEYCIHGKPHQGNAPGFICGYLGKTLLNPSGHCEFHSPIMPSHIEMDLGSDEEEASDDEGQCELFD